jgi:hypothetical protein
VEARLAFYNRPVMATTTTMNVIVAMMMEMIMVSGDE